MSASSYFYCLWLSHHLSLTPHIFISRPSFSQLPHFCPTPAFTCPGFWTFVSPGHWNLIVFVSTIHQSSPRLLDCTGLVLPFIPFLPFNLSALEPQLMSDTCFTEKLKPYFPILDPESWPIFSWPYVLCAKPYAVAAFISSWMRKT